MGRIRTMACVLVAVTLLVSLLGGSPFAATADSRRKIVIFDDLLTPAVLQAVFTSLALAKITVLYDLSSLINALAVELPLVPPLGTDPLALLEDLGTVTDDVLTFIDPICPTGVPVFEDPLQEYRWGMQQIKAPEAHMPWPPPSRQTGAVTVAVLDTGISPHSELSGRIVQGYNAITKTGVTTDDHGHGTHMAGIILANKNGEGVVGVAGVEPEALKIKVAAVKVLDNDGAGYLSEVINGLQWVREHGIRLVNMSFGFKFSKSNDGTPLMKAIHNLSKAGIIMVASAGNACCAGGVCDDGGGDGDCGPARNCPYTSTSMTAPATYSEVIAVGATNSAGQIPNYSLYSGKGPDVLAPGGEPLSGGPDNGQILSTNNVGYGRGNGTSQAAAHVTGAIALALSLNPELAPHAVKNLVTQNAVLNVLNVQNMINAVPQ